MNKFIFLFLNLLCSFAHAAGPTTIVVTTTSNLKIQENYKIVVEKNAVFFNSEKIDSVQIPLLVSGLKNLSAVKFEKSRPCHAGTYTHSVTKNKKTTKTSGCLESARASQLLQSLEPFKKSHIL